ncbi:transcription-repair coupling factor [Agaribacter flavus]|uniref:Transcription-repair-coupling factor n=1 Tax=Agaribacter flavus TaxID=1902781 RepID=A0ABV7FSF0_9ALTE
MSLTYPRLPVFTSTDSGKTSRGDHIHWSNLSGSSPAMAMAMAAKQHSGSLIIVTEDMAQAYKLEREIKFFLDSPTSIDVHLFPDWETLPYDAFSPHQDIVSKRLETLYLLSKNEPNIFLLPVNTLLQKVAPVEYVGQHLLYLKVGDRLDPAEFRRTLEKSGYLHVSQVMSHSEFSIRGSIIDLFPMGSEQPFRIDLFDDEIDTIHFFDTGSQRSVDKINEIRLLPAREFPTDKTAITQFRTAYLEKFPNASNSDQESVFYQVSRGTMPGGIEYYLPLFFAQTASLFDYLHSDSLLIVNDKLEQAANRFWQDLLQRYQQYQFNLARPLLPPEDLYLDTISMLSALKKRARVSITEKTGTSSKGFCDFKTRAIDDIAIDTTATNPYSAVQATIDEAKHSKTPVIFVAESAGHREALIDILNKAIINVDSIEKLSIGTINKPVSIAIGSVEDSYICHDPESKHLIITEKQLLGHKQSKRRNAKRAKQVDESAIIRNLAELSEGSPVVHLEHGVGRFLGMQTLDAGGIKTEFLSIEYAKQAKLYVPVSSLHLISRYSGGDVENAPLHNLGNDTWSKQKKKAAEKVRDVAAQLLDIYAKRAAKPGFAYPLDWQDYEGFANSFPYAETEDQAKAINAVIQDMAADRAMDRLVCGDVGFGKTEVAMRAAYIAASCGKQVAILVPTTLLAQQHFDNFKDRFSQFPFKISVMSRFISNKEQKQVAESIACGKTDIVVGTHKLLSKDIQFNDLGLVIIDEEHRFGVRQKEQFKALRADVDILTLTATPIPRTLNMAMSGMRDLSIIATPPAKRLSIKTFVMQKNSEVIREAIMREILRGGQVYFLHNEVKTIEQTAADIEEIVPEARIAIGHGQMRERELESVMNDFYHQRYNVLVCSTIIETGIDIPTANTIIMNRADNLGLAQMHQLRGRVGRSHHQAYAYLLTPHPRRMTKDAAKRLEAIASLEGLGAGFALATHDLEIRGAGELLGDDQSGQINSVGFSMYMDMLENAVEALKQGKEPSLHDAMHEQTEIELRIPVLLPDDYIGDVNTRLSLYKKLANCHHQDDIDDFQIELIDRFGLLPQATKNLVKITSFKLQAAALGIKKIEFTELGGMIEFDADTKVDPGFLIALIQKKPNEYRFDGPQRLKINKKSTDALTRIDLVERLLALFAKETNG